MQKQKGRKRSEYTKDDVGNQPRVEWTRPAACWPYDSEIINIVKKRECTLFTFGEIKNIKRIEDNVALYTCIKIYRLK